MNNHLMLDFETLGTNPDTAVLSLGAVHFTREKIVAEKLWVFDLEEQLRAKRSVNADTLLWWMGQGEKARAVFQQTKLGVSMRDFMPEFQAFIPKDTRVWGNGSTFDVSITENLLLTMKLPIPWKFWNVRCYRTLKSIHPIEDATKREGTHHNALDDARTQAQRVMAFLQKFPGADK